jgi:AcrR family transcriptional regulator
MYRAEQWSRYDVVITKGCDVATAKTAEARAFDAGSAGESGADDTFRHRLLEAMAESLAVNGYSNTTVADVVRIARTSRRTFYEYFPDREACFVALLTDNNGELIRAVTAAVDPNAPWYAQVRQAVEAWIAAAQSRPALMLAWIRDAPGLGAEAQRLQREFMQAFIDMVQALSTTAGIGPVSRQRAIMLLGGLHQLTDVAFQDGGRLDDITEEAVNASITLLAPGT